MKKIIHSIIVLFVMAPGFSQGLKIGVFVDPQISWISTESKSESKDGSHFGVNGGLILDHYFKKNYALQTGISLGTQGGGIKYADAITIDYFDGDTTLPAGSTVNYKINYITVPLGFKLKTNEIGYFSYYARIGFTNQFNIKTKASINDDDDNEILEKYVVEDEITLYNLAYHFGIGMEYAISEETSVTFGVVYHNGFINMSKRDHVKLYSRILSFRIGVIF